MNKKKMEKVFYKYWGKFWSFVFFVYQTVKVYLYNSDFRKKHISFGMVDGKFRVISVEHKDFIKNVQNKIDKLAKSNNQREFIKLALGEALTGCNYITLFIEGDDNKFIQYWTGKHNLEFDFYANNKNKMKKFYYPMLGLLAELGYVNVDVEKYKGYLNYRVKKTKSIINITTNFHKDINLATDLTDSIFKEIYKIKKRKIIATVD